MGESRLDILRKIETGELSAEEGLRLIGQLEGEVSDAGAEVGVVAQDAGSEADAPAGGKAVQGEVVLPEPAPDFRRWKTWSWVGFGLFTLLTAVSALWMVQGWQAHPFGWGFWLAWIPFLIGVAGMALMFNTRWLHIRIRQTPGATPERIAISIPFPFELISWFSRTFPQWMPEGRQGINLGEILDEMGHGISREEPIIIQVEDKDGEHVEIFIG